MWVFFYLVLNLDMRLIDQSYGRTGNDTPKWQADLSTTPSIPLFFGHVLACYL